MFSYTMGIVWQALEVYRKSMDIHNRNVINVNNPDYVQEDPEIESFAPAGVAFERVRRDQNVYLLGVRNTKLSLVEYLRERKSYLGNVEGIFQELFEGLGLNDYVNRFFKAYQDLMKEPTNTGAKNELVNSAKALSDFLRNRSKDIDRIDASLDFNLRESVRKANEIIRKLYVLNKDITVTYAQTYANGQDYKNILDTRDKYLRELSELINIQIQEDEIGRVKVITSKGFVLVDYTDSYWQLNYSGGKLYWVPQEGTPTEITNVIESGKIKAYLDARSDLARFKGELGDIAEYLISTVKIPREKSGTWYLVKNVSDNTQPLNTFGINGTLNFYDPSGNLITSITYDTLSLDDLANAINTNATLTSAGFSATVVSNPDGTYTIRISNSNPDYRVEDTSKNFYESSPVFSGTSLADIAPVSTLSSDLQDIKFEDADDFSALGTAWWNEGKRLVDVLISDISTTQADVSDKLRIEEALLENINQKLQEAQSVSLDREFIEIMRLQRTYDAIAKVVVRVDELLRTTIEMV